MAKRRRGRHGPKGRNSRRRNQGRIVPPEPHTIQFRRVGYWGDVCVDGTWINTNGYTDEPHGVRMRRAVLREMPNG